MTKSYEVKESSTFISTCADSAIVVGTNWSGEDRITIVFLNNGASVVCDEEKNLKFDSIVKHKVAEITMGLTQAEHFYNSIKNLFEVDIPAVKKKKGEDD